MPLTPYKVGSFYTEHELLPNLKKTLNDLQQTASSTRSITEKIDEFGTDLSKIIEDKELMYAIRSVTIGLGELFNELYPEQRTAR